MHLSPPTPSLDLEAGGSKKNGPMIPDEVSACWANILDDHSPVCFILTKYSADGKALEVVASGPEEGPAGGCGSDLSILRPNPGPALRVMARPHVCPQAEFDEGGAACKHG